MESFVGSRLGGDRDHACLRPPLHLDRVPSQMVLLGISEDFLVGNSRVMETSDNDVAAAVAGAAPVVPESASVTIGKTNIKFDFGTTKKD